MKILIWFSILLLSCHNQKSTVAGTIFTGKVIKIVDGDTYDILLDNNTTKRIRMEGIDAPEKGMAFYTSAKDYLGALCFGQVVSATQTSIDRYGRTVAKSFLSNGNELGLLMVEAGYAWHFKKYSTDAELANAELGAREKHLGLWVDENPMAPWDKRKRSKREQ